MLKNLTYKQLKYKKIIRLREGFIGNLRVLKFKRPKWNLLKKLVYNNFYKISVFGRWVNKKRATKIFEPVGYHVPLRWLRLRSYYRDSLYSKSLFFLYFGLRSRIRTLKRMINFSDSSSILRYVESRIDVVLWRSGFFSSPAIARFALNHGKINVNGNSLFNSFYLLNSGDLVSIDPFFHSFMRQRYSSFFSLGAYNKKFFTLSENLTKINPGNLEINWDTVEFIFLSPFARANSFFYLHNHYFNLSQIRNYLRLH